jgi:hypothetical protein
LAEESERETIVWKNPIGVDWLFSPNASTPRRDLVNSGERLPRGIGIG